MTMTRITQLEDRGAAVAWSPIASHADYIALGAKDSAGIGFEDTGGDLELCDLNITSPEGSSPLPRIVGTTKTTSRFASIDWTPGSDVMKKRFPMGLIAGGMTDGTVYVWNPQAIIKKEEALVATIKRHAGGAVKALQFSTLSPNMMATGGSDGQVLITNLDNPSQPVVTMPGTEPSKGAEVTKLAWNTQVAHIVAAAAGDGAVTIWDLNAKKPWCRVQAESSGIPISDLQWNPTQGLHLVTASGDDRNPLLKLWDLRASTTMPLATLSGHSQGILGLAWCPHDDTLLMSCGKDNRTILWDLYTLQPIADIPNDDPAQQQQAIETQNSAELFSAGGLSSSQQKRYDVQWSPLKRGVVSTCSFDRKVQAHSVIGLATKSGRSPKWLAPSSGVSCSFGAAVVSFSSNDKVVKIRTVVEEPDLVKASNEFEAEMAKGETIAFCQSMAAQAEQKHDPSEAQVWAFMQVIFEANARQRLLEHLGFHADTIETAAMEFNEDIVKGTESMSVQENSTAPMSKKTEDAVKAALLVGNFGAAVECCFRTGNLADALILASCGGADLWSKTQERYFEMEAKKRPFLSVVSAVIRNKLDELVAASRPSRWQETLAIISTYGQSEEFPLLCIALGDRLESVGDFKNASLCYMCSLSLDKAVSHWRSQLEAKNKAKGRLDLMALHNFVVKVTVFMKAVDSSVTLDEGVAEIFAQYANALAEQGLLVTAAKYCRGTSPDSKILRDRLYRSRESPACLAALGSAPEFPFTLTQVNKAPARSAATSQGNQRRQPQSYTNQQAASQNSSRPQNQTAYGTQQQVQPSASNQALPDGWVALQDPSSGRTYYANKTTGQSTWEMPQPVAPAPAPVAPMAAQPGHPSMNGATQQPVSAQPQSQQQQRATTPATSNGGSRSATPSRLAKKYGDGFVTSSSHPELGQQYGNVGTGNPYGGERHGIAQVEKTGKAPVSGTFDPNALEILAEHEHIKDILVELAASLNSAPLTPVDKRQMSEAEKGIAVLLKRLFRGDIDDEVSHKVDHMVTSLRSRDYATAAAIQSGLANSDWKDHKDWLKGIKFLIQLATKKLQ